MTNTISKYTEINGYKRAKYGIYIQIGKRNK